MGNPPFVGREYQTKEQKDDLALIFQGLYQLDEAKGRIFE